MSEVMKIFIGADEYGADFPSLAKLRIKSLSDGFHTFRNWINLQENLGNFTLENISFAIRGGYTGICIAHSVEFLLGNNANFVLVDLPNCRYDETDLLTTPESINKRREDVILGIELLVRTDPRLKFTTKQ